MPNFAANLTMLYNEVPFLDRFERAARSGFRAVEFLFPYEHDPRELRRRMDDNGLQLVLHNLPPGNWEGGERGIGCHPDRVAELHPELQSRAADMTVALNAAREILLGKQTARRR